MKKKIIAGLLFISCCISGWLLFMTSENQTIILQKPEQADSLIDRTFTDFNIQLNQISTHTSKLDSFSRKTFTVYVPPAFSKTQFHSALKRRFSVYPILLPARVILPEQDMHIYVNYHQTVIRTIKLITDDDLSIQQSFASIIMAVDHQPSVKLLQMLKSLGEPIPLAVVMKPPYTLPEWWRRWSKRYVPFYIWPKTADGSNLLASNSTVEPGKLETLANKNPGLIFLSFSKDSKSFSLGNASTFVKARNAMLFNDATGKAEFKQMFRQFIQEARSGSRPLAIVMASHQIVPWMKNELNIFRKTGFTITPPTKKRF